jgi:ABC-type nitrate/sulfonate/bicarbonate transport system substrate-binding protein
MGKRKWLLFGAVILVVIGVWATFTMQKPSEPTDGLVTLKVRLKWLHQAQFAGFYVAREKGFYRDEGLDVTLNAGGVDFPAVQMVAGGGEDFGVTAADQILLAREKGVPVVALAVIYRKSPMVYFALKKSGIKTPQDFIGKKVGVKLGGNEELTYRAMMKKVGIDANQLTEIPVKYDMTPLFTGQVDVWPGYAINEPIVAEEKGFPVDLIWPPDYGVTLYADAIFTTESTAKERPDIVERFIRATLRGWEHALQHPEEAVEYTLRYGKELNREHELKMMQASIPLVKPDDKPVGWMELSTWEEMGNLLLSQGFIKQPVDVGKAYTAQFLSNNLAKETRG